MGQSSAIKTSRGKEVEWGLFIHILLGTRFLITLQPYVMLTNGCICRRKQTVFNKVINPKPFLFYMQSTVHHGTNSR